MLGGPPTPGIGFGIGIERLLLACDAEGVFAVAPAPLDAFVVDVTGGEAARDLTAELRRAGLRADRAFDGRSLKSQMKAADRSGARVALIVGPDEIGRGYGVPATPAGRRGPAHRARSRGGRGGRRRPSVGSVSRPAMPADCVPGPVIGSRTRKDHP